MDHAGLIAENARYRDQMSHAERLAAYACGKQVDRLPVAISVRENLAPLYGFTQGEYRRDFQVRADVYRKAQADFDCLGVSIGPNLKKIGEALGAKVHYPEQGPDYLSDLPLGNYRDLVALEVPSPRKNPVLRALLDDIAAYKQQFGDDFPVTTEIGGPLTTAISLRPLQSVLLDLILTPQPLSQLLDFAVACQLAWVEEAYRCFGVAGVNIADPTATASLISPEMFREFVLPRLRRLAQGVMQITGRRPGLHICGKSEPLWPDLADCGCAAFRVDSCERLDALKQAVGKSLALVGNIPPVEVMQQGGIDEVLAAGRDCIYWAADNPCGFTLAAGCQLPPGVSADNLLAMLLAARKFGREARKGRICAAAEF